MNAASTGSLARWPTTLVSKPKHRVASLYLGGPNMTQYEKFPIILLEQLARALAECDVRSTLNWVSGIVTDDYSHAGPLSCSDIVRVLIGMQEQGGSGDKVIELITLLLEPVRFAREPHRFEDIRQKVNLALAFAGLRFNDDATIEIIEVARTIDDAIVSASNIPPIFLRREYHKRVATHLVAGRLEENPFEVAYDTLDDLVERIRTESKVNHRPPTLFDKAFGEEKPRIAITVVDGVVNRVDQQSFLNSVKGLYAMVASRRIYKPGQCRNEDALVADYLSLISLMHRRLDYAIRVVY